MEEESNCCLQKYNIYLSTSKNKSENLEISDFLEIFYNSRTMVKKAGASNWP